MLESLKCLRGWFPSARFEADGGHYVGWTLHKKADGKDLKVRPLPTVISLCDMQYFGPAVSLSRMTSGFSLMTTTLPS